MCRLSTYVGLALDFTRFPFAWCWGMPAPFVARPPSGGCGLCLGRVGQRHVGPASAHVLGAVARNGPGGRYLQTQDRRSNCCVVVCVEEPEITFVVWAEAYSSNIYNRLLVVLCFQRPGISEADRGRQSGAAFRRFQGIGGHGR